MDRQELLNNVLKSTSVNIGLELPTGYGKTKIALEKVNQWYKENNRILIVCPKLVLFKEWEKEINKWKFDKLLFNISFSTYVGINKYSNQHFDIIIYDECQHLSERCIDFLQSISSKYQLFLSATLNKEVKNRIYDYCSPKYFEIFKIKVKEAISSNILPEPVIYLIPLVLNNTEITEKIIKNKRKNTDINKIPVISYEQRWQYRKIKTPYIINCTQRQYYTEMSEQIEWSKKMFMCGNTFMKNRWLYLAGERLKWLSNLKLKITSEILEQVKWYYRSIVFCNTIDQTLYLGNSVNSIDGTDNLNYFNNKKINYITSVGMLNEGVNLTSCQIGIFNSLNNSDILTIQRIGRILRHENPYIIIPYFINTRDEELKDKLLLNFTNKNKIVTIDRTENITI